MLWYAGCVGKVLVVNKIIVQEHNTIVLGGGVRSKRPIIAGLTIAQTIFNCLYHSKLLCKLLTECKNAVFYEVVDVYF